MAEHQALLDAILVGRVHRGRAAEVAAAFGTLSRAQVPPAGAGAHDFPAGRYLKALGRGLLGSDAFWTSHKSVSLLSKRARNIGGAAHLIKLYFRYLIGSARRGGGRIPSFGPPPKDSVSHFLDAAGARCCIWFAIGASAVIPPGGGEFRTRQPNDKRYG